ncbi:MAG: hypothetical protein J6B87_03915 [Clostridia bacterium]|nr:hypothetical protein [Clostridia bacterium]
MKKIMRFVSCCILTIVLTISIAHANDFGDEMFWCKVEQDGRVIYMIRKLNHSKSWVFNLMRDGADWYLKYNTGDAILLNDFELQYSSGEWYVSSNAMQRALDAYEKENEASVLESDFILIESNGTIFTLEDGSTYILKAEYQPEKLVGNQSDFGIAVIFENESIPKFWITLSTKEYHIENSANGIQISVAELAIEKAIKSYLHFSKFY